MTVTLTDCVNPRHESRSWSPRPTNTPPKVSRPPARRRGLHRRRRSSPTDSNGQACFKHNLTFGDYTVHETTPAGYIEGADETVTVDNKASCTDIPYVSEPVAFSNTPLSTITITFFSQVPGGTAVTEISSTELTDSNPDPDSATFNNLVPRAPTTAPSSSIHRSTSQYHAGRRATWLARRPAVEACPGLPLRASVHKGSDACDPESRADPADAEALVTSVDPP